MKEIISRLSALREAKGFRHVGRLDYLLFLVFFCGFSGFYLAFNEYVNSKKSFYKVRDEIAWFDSAKAFLKAGGERSVGQPRGRDSLLAMLNREVKKYGVIIERADFKGKNLIVVLREAPFEDVVVFLNSIENSPIYSLGVVNIDRVGAGTCVTKFSIFLD